MDIKTAIVFSILGIVQGVILCDWYRTRMELKALEPKPFKSKAVRRRQQPAPAK
jgi:hypothetical protein